ncbi:hypothetical protein H0H93_004026 [Arthromyces matolae]|nr:hypothetical protein H0H93_004026 [Arthromyces matolae]
MGFLKRLFSIGSKKNKKERPQIVHNVDAKQRALEEEAHEAAIGRLLRSSSTRYTVVSEVEYSSLPPLPHPINDVLQAPPTTRTRGASTTSIASSTISQRGTYNVTVHSRTQHATLDSQKTKSKADDNSKSSSDSRQNKEVSSQLLELRSHPSVASLLTMYDEHGRISDQAFSNSPSSHEKRQHPQKRRNGSTLRQLLGEPAGSTSSRNSSEVTSFEGDISWAERFLGEGDSASSAMSSVGLRTPSTEATHENHDAIENDFSMNTYENPAISSMDVELSIVADSIFSVDETPSGPYKSHDPATPQRASQVFNFLTERKRTSCVDERDQSLSELPSVFSISSEEVSPSQSTENRSHDSMDLIPITHAHPMLPRPLSTQVEGITRPNLLQDTSAPLNVTPPNATKTLWEAPDASRIQNIVNAPTRVIITAPTPSGKLNTPSRIPRGPRSQYRKSLSHSHNKTRRASTLTDRGINVKIIPSHSPDALTSALLKHKQQRIPSNGSSSSTGPRHVEIGPPTRLSRKGSSRSILSELDKENGPQLSVKATLPSTPLRSKSDSKSLFRTAVTPSLFRPHPENTPSPASSSDLSPIGKKMMMDIRKQRSKARDVDRQKSRFGYNSPLVLTVKGMSSTRIIDFLTKQIFIERNVVTYRSLSRELRLTVNTAKNELANFHENAPYQSQTSYATYLICGEIDPPFMDEMNIDYGKRKDVEEDGEDGEYDGDDVPQIKFLLVNEPDLENAKVQFSRVNSIHMYSLSPSQLRDASYICTPTEQVRAADRGKDGKELAKIVGRVVSSDINLQLAQAAPRAGKATRQPIAGPSRVSRTTVAKDPSVETPKAQNTTAADNSKDKPKATGKLNFFKPKAKEQKSETPVAPVKGKEKGKEEPKESKEQSKQETVPVEAPSPPPPKAAEPTKVYPSLDTIFVDVDILFQQKGTKRKSALDVSDSEEEREQPLKTAPLHPPKENIRVQGRALISDDEEDEPIPARKPRKIRAVAAAGSDNEEVLAMMDIDDDQVTHVTRNNKLKGKVDKDDDNRPEGEEEGEGKNTFAADVDADVDMADDTIPKIKTKKRAPKKAIPVGRNGLKKRRVVKSKSLVDEKGYMVFEDYSEYESVEEEEEPEPPRAKGKTKVKPKDSEKESTDEGAPAAKLKPATKPAEQPSKVKASKSGETKGPKKQGKMTNFFAPKPKKSKSKLRHLRRHPVHHRDSEDQEKEEQATRNSSEPGAFEMVQTYGVVPASSSEPGASDGSEHSALLGGDRDTTVKRQTKPDGHASLASCAMASAGVIPVNVPEIRGVLRCCNCDQGLMPNVVQSFYHVLTPATTNPPAWMLNGANWITIFMAVLGPLAFLRKLDSLRHTSYVALFSVGAWNFPNLNIELLINDNSVSGGNCDRVLLLAITWFA